jgi:hypothetical protein
VSFSAFIAQYYEERLHAYERLDLARCAEAELLDIAGEASALHKSLTDLLEEGYPATVNRLIEQTDAMHRLQIFAGVRRASLVPGKTLCSSRFGVVEEGVFSIGVSTFSETSGRIRGVLSC